MDGQTELTQNSVSSSRLLILYVQRGLTEAAVIGMLELRWHPQLRTGAFYWS